MNMEATFILTYVGTIAVATVLGLLLYWIWEGHKKPLSRKVVKAKIRMAVNVVMQLALLWFCSMGIAFCLAMLYWIFARPAELTALAAVIVYVIGVAATIGMWTAIWRMAEKN